MLLCVICYQLPTQSTLEAKACVLSDLKIFSKTAARNYPMTHSCQHHITRVRSGTQVISHYWKLLLQSAESGGFISISHDQPSTVPSTAETLLAVAAVTTHSGLLHTRAQTSASRRRPNRPVMSLTMPPLGDGDDEGDEEGDGDDPVMEDTADVTGDVTEDAGDDSEGAGPTPPAATYEECVHDADGREPNLQRYIDCELDTDSISTQPSSKTCPAYSISQHSSSTTHPIGRVPV